MKCSTTIAIAVATALFAIGLMADNAPAVPEKETYAKAMDAARKLRNEKKLDEAADAAQRAADLAAKPDDKSRALWTKGDIYWGKAAQKQEQYLLEALAVPGISPSQRAYCAGDLIKKVYAKQGQAGYEKALALADGILADPAFSNALNRISLSRDIAGVQFEHFDVDAAEKRLADLERLPGLTPNERQDALRAQAGLQARKCDFAAAGKLYARIYADSAFNANARLNALIDACKLLDQDRCHEEIIALCTKYLADTSLPGRESRLTELLANAFIAKNDFAAARKAVAALAFCETTDARYKAELAKKAKTLDYTITEAEGDLAACKAKILADKDFFRGNGLVRDLADLFFARGDYASVIELADLYWPMQKTFNWQVEKPFVNTMVAFWRTNDASGLAKFIDDSLVTLTGLDTQHKLGYTIVAKYLANGKKLTKGDVRGIVGKTDGKIAKDALAIAAKVLVRLGLHDEPQMLNDYRQSLFVGHKRNIAAVRYVKNAPTDVGSWIASGLMTEKEKHVCDVKFGKEAAERLITDVAVIRGDAVNASAAEESAAWFWICYDEYGIHFIFEHKDPKFQEVLTGKTRSTDYETYFGIEELGPAYQFGVNPTKREFDYCPPWNSPHKYFRLLADYADFSSRPSKEGYATAMNVSWELAYNRLPENGTEWPFEMIYWSRSGGLTWGGTDIWQRSNWGHWKFEGMTREVKSAIHRVIVYKALARYNGEKNIARGGIIGTWQDKELGDPAFYEAELKPLVDKLDAYAKEAEGEMTDALADKLFAEAVPSWYDFRVLADEIRTRYLQNQLTE